MILRPLENESEQCSNFPKVASICWKSKGNTSKMKRFSYYNINGWICLYLALKNNLKKVKKGVDKRGGRC